MLKFASLPARVRAVRVNPARVRAMRASPTRVNAMRASLARVRAMRASPTRVNAMRTSLARTSPARVSPVRTSPACVNAMRASLARVRAMRASLARVRAMRASPARTNPVRVSAMRTSPVHISPMRILRDKLACTRGFTIAEMLVSIAALALIAGFVLQMFLVASQVNRKTRELDRAAWLCADAVEAFKSWATPEEAARQGAQQQTDGSYRSTLWFDEQGTPTAPETAYFSLTWTAGRIDEAPDIAANLDGTGALAAEMWRMVATAAKTDETEPLAELTAQHYFAYAR